MSAPMTPEEHRARHQELHRALDELIADWIACGPRGLGQTRLPSRHPISELMEWSAKQTREPETPNI